jgi:signal transduction histidine kinase
MTNDFDIQVFQDDIDSTPVSNLESSVETRSKPLSHGKQDALIVLIVDDDEAIHIVTRYALKKFLFEGQSVEMISAYSSAEAKQILHSTPNIAVILLDVVMDGRDAGLQLVQYIRNELHNRFVRIVLRTGQPGEAPEFDVIRDYDINDYRSKTELSDVRLMTVITVALKTYKDMMELEKFRAGLEVLAEQRSQELQKSYQSLQSSYAELDKTNAELNAVNHSKSQILAVVAHDLKNPLGVVIGFASMGILELENDPIDRASLQGILLSIDASSKSMTNLIENLLDSASIELGEMSVVPDTFSLGSLVEAVSESFTEPAARKNQSINIEIEENVMISGDGMRLRQVFENLISNALKYSPPHSTIFVRLYRTPKEQITTEHILSSMETSNATLPHLARFEIQDSGPGISNDDKKLMFRFFQRLSATPTGNESSHGVGLAIAKQIVTLHKGRIWVESRKDEGVAGSTFVVELPILH